MKISMTVEGVRENITALETLKSEIPAETRIALSAGLQPIVGAMKAYPPARLTRYRRTGNYGARISGPTFTQQGGETTAYINSAAPYSTYLRGDLAGYPGAWMHRGIWETLTSIIERLLPQAIRRIEQQLERLIRRVGLGE